MIAVGFSGLLKALAFSSIVYARWCSAAHRACASWATVRWCTGRSGGRGD
jgi:hypothetical protein